MPNLPNSAGDEFVHPNLDHQTQWSLHCTVCGLASYNGSVPRFESTEKLWRVMLARGWTRRDDGRVLCVIHSHVADCDRDGHEVTDWMPQPIEPTALEWRYCQRCGANFDQRVRSMRREMSTNIGPTSVARISRTARHS
jgi:hypothetical protein